jgi:tripartite-type tricarboxylate transporter receptor subunit TctC
MTLNRRHFLTVASAASLTSLAAKSAEAQAAYPSAGPIRMVAPFAPAGSIDILARIVAEALASRLGQSVVVENRSGAGGNIGMGAAARATPDGYTILFTSSVIVVNPMLHKSVPFDPYKDFIPIALLATSPNLLMAKPEFAKTLSEFVEQARKRPGALNYASPGIGTKGHFAAELLKHRAAIDVAHVPYSSGAQIAQSVMTGTTQMGSTALPAGEGFVREGSLAGLCVTSEKRWPTLPDVPSLTELGYDGFVAELFTALYAPSNTPDHVVEKLIDNTGRLVRDQTVVERAERAGYAWIGAGPDALRRKMAEETAQTREVIKYAGLRAQ